MGQVVKVSSRSSPNAVAGALAHVVRSEGTAEVQVVGAGALNQAVKAIAIARAFLAPAGLDVACKPTFADVKIDGENRTAIRLLVEGGPPGPAGTDNPGGTPLEGDHDVPAGRRRTAALQD